MDPFVFVLTNAFPSGCFWFWGNVDLLFEEQFRDFSFLPISSTRFLWPCFSEGKPLDDFSSLQ